MDLEKSQNNFFLKAERFCNFLEEFNKFDLNNCYRLIIELTSLYLETMKLKTPKNISDFDISMEVDRVFIDFGEYDTYNEVYNPYYDEELVCGSLQDDFADIHNDLKIGLNLYNQGLEDEAAFQWWWSFNHHWCYHAVDALRTLNTIYIEKCDKI